MSDLSNRNREGHKKILKKVITATIQNHVSISIDKLRNNTRHRKPYYIMVINRLNYENRDLRWKSKMFT